MFQKVFFVVFSGTGSLWQTKIRATETRRTPVCPGLFRDRLIWENRKNKKAYHTMS